MVQLPQSIDIKIEVVIKNNCPWGQTGRQPTNQGITSKVEIRHQRPRLC